MNAPVSRNWWDSFNNLLSSIGVLGRDKGVGSVYVVNEISEQQAVAAYRADWIARKAIDIPANDSTREWRAWQAEQEQITALEEFERKFAVQQKLNEALIKARLYGGAALVLGVDDPNRQEEELNIERIGKDSLKFLHVVSRYEITAGQLIKDVLSPWYGEPEYWERQSNDMATYGSQVKIHPSRIIRLIGNDRPDRLREDQPWGDSVLQTLDDAVKAAGLVQASIATLISEAKIDIIKIPDLTNILSSTEGQTRLANRFSYANVNKSIINALILDGLEEWQRINVQFTGMPEVMQMYMLIAAAAADIPVTRMLAQSPAGMNATGESDIRNFYDRIHSDQEKKLTPTIERLDEVIIRGALGSRPEEIFYTWNPLWQLSETEKAAVAQQKATTANLDNTMGLIPFTALMKGRQNQLIEDGTYPGLEQAIQDAEDEGDIVEPPPDEITRTALEARASQGQLPSPFDSRGGVHDNRPFGLSDWIALGAAIFGDFNPAHIPSGEHGGEFAPRGTPTGPIPVLLGKPAPKEQPEFFAKLEHGTEDQLGEIMPDITDTFGDESTKGWLTLNGRAIEIGDTSHETAAIHAGANGWRGMMEAGGVRFYIELPIFKPHYQSEGMLGFEMWKPPTREQIRTIVSALDFNSFGYIFIDVGGRGDNTVTVDKRPEGLSAKDIRAAIVQAFPEMLPKRTHDAPPWTEQLHPRVPHGTGGGRFTTKAKPTKPSKEAVAFVSPNVGNLSFEEAQSELASSRQNLLLQASRYIDRKLGINGTFNRSVLGAWTDGAENSVMVTMPNTPMAVAKAASAMKGWLTDQKSVLVFEPGEGGKEYMAAFEMQGRPNEIHDMLLQAGVAYHTMEPSPDGAIVRVYGNDQETLDNIGKAANGQKIELIFGKGEFVGTSKQDGTDREQRDDAKQIYEQTIEQLSTAPELRGRDLGKIWNDVRDRWQSLSGEAGEELKHPNARGIDLQHAETDDSGYSTATIYHGSSAELGKFNNSKPIYLTTEKEEAAGFAHGMHLGGTPGGKPSVYEIKFKPGKVKDIDDAILEGIEAGDDILDTIDQEIENAYRAKDVRYLTFDHPRFFTTSSPDEGGFKAAVSLYPGDDLKIVGKKAAAKSGKRQHPGHGYTKQSYIENGIIYTTDVKDAARALYEGRKVDLKQPREVATLIEHLGQVAKNMERLGAKAPVFNLCNVTVGGTNLFCVESKNVPRVKMPQLTDQQTTQFIKQLVDGGYKVDMADEFASYLRATQAQLNGAKVAKSIKWLREHPDTPPRRIIVSRDNYILDGHHTWAGKIGLDAADGNLTNDLKQPIARVAIGIIELLEKANEFTGGKGRKSASDEWQDDAGFEEEEHPRVPKGTPETGGQFAHKPGEFHIPSWISSKDKGQHLKRVVSVLKKKAGASKGYRWNVQSLIKEHQFYGLSENIDALKMKIAESFYRQGKKLQSSAGLPPDPKLVKAQKLINKASKLGYMPGASEVHPAVVELEKTLSKAKEIPSLLAKPIIEREPSGPVTLSGEGWKKVGPQKGSNPGGTYEDQSGDEWYIKVPKTEDHVNSDLFANAMYSLAGISVPLEIRTKLNGQPAVASLMLKGTPLGQLKDEAKSVVYGKLQAGFAVDAWLGNRDVIGQDEDNIIVVGEEPYRIDQGGTLHYRAQGDLKDYFGEMVPEMAAMRDEKTNPASAKIFGSMSIAQLANSIDLIAGISDTSIRDLAMQYNQKEVGETLIKRKQWLLGNLPSKETSVQSIPSGPDKALAEKPVEPEFKSLLTPQQEAKAKKSTPYPATGYPEADIIIEEFNKQYAGKTLTDPKELVAKVEAFTAMMEKVNTAKTKAKAVEEQQAAIKAKAQAEEQAKEFGLDTPEGKLHFETLSALTGGYGSEVKEFLETAKHKLKLAGLEDVMSPGEAALIGAYSSSYFVEVNKQLRARQITETQYKFALSLNKALDKLPPYNGIVYRKTDLPKEVAKKYIPGYIVVEDGFTSSASHKGVWSGDYYYTIHSKKNGKNIQPLSHHGHEAEILFKAGSHFRVLSRDGYNIELEELDF